ncbi:UNVERIFIED_CONTAM: hypothetical protein Sangu_0685300 [Sesamum angustifolium]|uniref:Transposase n=1 Tax=Sesamum angustifolium TaxID=2727405 RepID=A0AAW2PTL8_9LAMI
MTFGWSTVGVMGCPVCMDGTRAFHLQHGRNACYFDCHRQFLPAHHPYRRNKKTFTKNHVENKVARPRLIGDQILDRVANISLAVEILLLLPDEVMDIKGKTKDNMNAQRNLTIICNCLELELDERRPNVILNAVYTVGKKQKRRVCEWIRGLKFPVGYASNLTHCVDMTEIRMHSVKSHDCHIFMQKLIPIAFCEILLEHVWNALTEYFKPDMQSKRSMPCKNDECMSNNDGFQVSIFNYPGRANGVTK